MVEVLVAHRALFFAKELGFEKVILEGDSEIAICAVKSDAFSAAPFGHIVFDIKSLLAHFRCLIFQYTRRQGNIVAHSLAWAACNFPPFLLGWRKSLYLPMLCILQKLSILREPLSLLGRPLKKKKKSYIVQALRIRPNFYS